MRFWGKCGVVFGVIVLWILVCGCSGAESPMAPSDRAAWFELIQSWGCPADSRTVEDCRLAVDLRAVPLGMAVMQHVEFEGADALYVRLRWYGEWCPGPVVEGMCQIQAIFGPYERAGGAENVVIGMGSLGEHEIGYTLLVGGSSAADTVLRVRVVE